MSFKELKMDNDMKELEKFNFNYKGKSIAGKLLSYKENKKFKGRWFIIIDDDDTTNKIINCSTDLKRKMDYFMNENIINIGETIKIEYTDDKKCKFKNPLKQFKISVKE